MNGVTLAPAQAAPVGKSTTMPSGFASAPQNTEQTPSDKYSALAELDQLFSSSTIAPAETTHSTSAGVKLMSTGCVCVRMIMCKLQVQVHN
jgi:hypothetical protein